MRYFLSMNLIQIHSLDDPRIALYREIKESERLNVHGLFVAEGEHLVRRLLRSHYETHSLLIEEAYHDKLAQDVTRDDLNVYTVDKKLIRQIAGYDFNRGALALGVRRALPSPQALIPLGKETITLVICPEINDAENLGAILRTASAFNVDGVILGERCRDPFYRRTLRVSMGAVFTLPLAQSVDLHQDLLELYEQHHLALVATVLHDATGSLGDFIPPARLGLLFGNESQGLAAEWLNLCEKRITLPMALQTDSLNVAVAAGIFLYHCTQVNAKAASATLL